MSDTSGETKKKYNSSGFYNPDDIINQIVSFNGLFEKIFGKLLPPLVYNSNVENSIHLLEQVYWKKDARKIFPKKLDRKEFGKISETVFRIVKDWSGKE